MGNAATAQHEMLHRDLGNGLRPPSPLLDERAVSCATCVLCGEGLFSRLDPDEIDNHLRPVRSGLCPANQVIYRAGEPAISAYAIRSGVVKLVRRAPDGAERIVRLLGRGATVGLEAFDAECYESCAIATRESDLCRIPRSVLVGLGQCSPGFHAALAGQWRARAMQSEIWTSRLRGGTLDDRARWLIRELCEVSGDPPEAVQLLRNDDMAELLRVSPETLSRSMARLKRCRLIRRVGPWKFDCRAFLG